MARLLSPTRMEGKGLAQLRAEQEREALGLRDLHQMPLHRDRSLCALHLGDLDADDLGRDLRLCLHYADSLHLVVRGRFGARVLTPLGDSVLIEVFGPGQSFGELALLLPDARRSATVEALESGETRSMFRDDFDRSRR